MILTMFIFSAQDGLSKLLAESYHPIFVVLIRFWAFAAFVVVLSQIKFGGPVKSAKTKKPFVQFLRGLLLVSQIALITYSFAELGLAETHAIMAVYPLIIAAMGAFVLKENVSVSQWIAIAVGFIGVLVILQPGEGVFDIKALIPLVCAVMFATYGVLTRWVGGFDQPNTSFFYTGIAGAIGITLIGPFFWESMATPDWIWMAILCVTGAAGHFCLIKAYEFAQAAELQPYAYLQLVLTSLIGLLIFDEILDLPLIIGSALVVGAGLYALLRGRAKPAS